MSTCGQALPAVHSHICGQHCEYTCRYKEAALVPGWDEGRGGCCRAGQRQRIDITRPATIRPNPMAKFQGPMVDMNGMLSPAT